MCVCVCKCVCVLVFKELLHITYTETATPLSSPTSTPIFFDKTERRVGEKYMKKVHGGRLYKILGLKMCAMSKMPTKS